MSILQAAESVTRFSKEIWSLLRVLVTRAREANETHLELWKGIPNPNGGRPQGISIRKLEAHFRIVYFRGMADGSAYKGPIMRRLHLHSNRSSNVFIDNRTSLHLLSFRYRIEKNPCIFLIIFRIIDEYCFYLSIVLSSSMKFEILVALKFTFDGYCFSIAYCLFKKG